MPLPPIIPLSHLCGPTLLPSVEVSCPKTINKKQHVSTNNFSVNNIHSVIKSSQATQLYITKVFYKQFSCHLLWQIFLKLTFSCSVQSQGCTKLRSEIETQRTKQNEMKRNITKRNEIYKKAKRNATQRNEIYYNAKRNEMNTTKRIILKCETQ